MIKFFISQLFNQYVSGIVWNSNLSNININISRGVYIYPQKTW